MRVTEKTGWGDIILDTERGTVTVLQRWQYVAWEIAEKPYFDPKAWTEADKRLFHQGVVAQIQQGWGHNGAAVRFYPTGLNPRLRKYKKSGLKFLIDIRRVTANPHWRVTVRKVSQFDQFLSNVNWTQKKLTIRADLDPMKYTREGRVTSQGKPLRDLQTWQPPAPHEFGHMIGYLIDEYKQHPDVGSRKDLNKDVGKYYTDAKSMMNIGVKLRKRHFDAIDEILDKMLMFNDFDVEIKQR